MDPDECLAEMLRICLRLDGPTGPIDSDTDRLCDLVRSLDGWMCSGGFPPARWARGEKGQDGETRADS